MYPARFAIIKIYRPSCLTRPAKFGVSSFRLAVDMTRARQSCRNYYSERGHAECIAARRVKRIINITSIDTPRTAIVKHSQCSITWAMHVTMHRANRKSILRWTPETSGETSGNARIQRSIARLRGIVSTRVPQDLAFIDQPIKYFMKPETQPSREFY